MIDDHTKRLEAAVKKAQDELAQIARLRDEFPDLETHVDRWKCIRYMAASANARVFQVEFRNSCGCCRDTPVVALPYLEFEGMRVYSNPCYFYVGERTWGGYVQAEPTWRKQYETAGISYHAVAKIKKFLEEQRRREEDEDVEVA